MFFIANGYHQNGGQNCVYSMQIIYSVCDNRARKREVCGFELSCSRLYRRPTGTAK